MKQKMENNSEWFWKMVVKLKYYELRIDDTYPVMKDGERCYYGKDLPLLFSERQLRRLPELKEVTDINKDDYITFLRDNNDILRDYVLEQREIMESLKTALADLEMTNNDFKRNVYKKKTRHRKNKWVKLQRHY